MVASHLPASEPSEPRTGRWRERLVPILRVAIIVALVLLLCWLVADVLLLIFAGLLLAVFLRGLADWVSRWTRLPAGLSLAVVILALIVLFGGTAYLLAPSASEQLNQLFTSLPKELHQLEQKIGQTGWGKTLIEQVQPGSGAASQAVAGRVFGVATSTVAAITGFIVVIFIGLYVAAEPGIYLAGTLRLIAPARRPRIGEVLRQIAQALRWWLAGRIISMAIIAVLTAIGLWLLDVPLALTLGILSGLLAFVPYVGSVSSAIPPILIALTKSTELALFVIALYVVVHIIEGYILVPLMQKRMVHLPPALTLAAQAILGTLFGILGLALATPFAAACVTAIRLLYVEDVLHDHAAELVPESRPVHLRASVKG